MAGSRNGSFSAEQDIYVECRAIVGPKDKPKRFAKRSARILFKALFQNVLRGLDKMTSMFTA
jgi:hypothetical protein